MRMAEATLFCKLRRLLFVWIVMLPLCATVRIQIGAMYSSHWASRHAAAAKIAARRINENATFLPGIELELVEIDLAVVNRADQMVYKQCLLRDYLGQKLVNASAIVGVGYSSDLIALSPFATSRRIPVVSHASASSEFSNKSAHPFVARIAKPVSAETPAFFGVLQEFIPDNQKRGVKILSCDDAYCRDCARDVKAIAQSKDVRVIRDLEIRTSSFINDPTMRCAMLLHSSSLKTY